MSRYLHCSGRASFFLISTVNPHCPEYKALIRGDGVFAGSAIPAMIFKTKLFALMQLIQKSQILGTVSALV
jgi:hypothetical protein